MRKVTARKRTDGEKTRETLIDAAGRLAAKKGWANVTAKEVCDLAGVNTASINYWFGSRDKLYEAVLRRIPETIFSRELEIEMVQYETPEAALDCFFSYHLRNMDAENSWPMKVWAREVTGYPSEAFKALVQKEGVTRISVLKQFFADYLGLEDLGDIRLQVAFMTSVSILFFLMIASPELKQVTLPSLKEQPREFKKLVKERIFTSLRLSRTEIAATKRN